MTHLKITLLYLKTTEDKSINIVKNKKIVFDQTQYLHRVKIQYLQENGNELNMTNGHLLCCIEAA